MQSPWQQSWLYAVINSNYLSYYWLNFNLICISWGALILQHADVGRKWLVAGRQEADDTADLIPLFHSFTFSSERRFYGHDNVCGCRSDCKWPMAKCLVDASTCPFPTWKYNQNSIKALLLAQVVESTGPKIELYIQVNCPWLVVSGERARIRAP